MKAFVIAGALGVGLCLISGSHSIAGDRSGVLLTPSEPRAYRTRPSKPGCRTIVTEIGKTNGYLPSSLSARVIANGGGRFPLEGRTWSNTDDYCWAAAQEIR